MDKKPIRLVAKNFDIERLDAVLEWIYLVKKLENRHIIWMRAKRIPWCLICKRFGRTRRTLSEWHNEGLDDILKTLNNPQSPIVLENQNLLATSLEGFKITSENQTCIEGSELGKITVFRLQEEYFPSAKQCLIILAEKKFIAANERLSQPILKGLTTKNTFDIWDCTDKTQPLVRIMGRQMILMVGSDMFIILSQEGKMQKTTFPIMQD